MGDHRQRVGSGPVGKTHAEEAEQRNGEEKDVGKGKGEKKKVIVAEEMRDLSMW